MEQQVLHLGAGRRKIRGAVTIDINPRVVAVMEEIHRLGRPGARVYIRSPHFSSWQFYTDPTHRHPFAARSFDYFVPGTALFAYDYSLARFRKRCVALDTRPRDPLSNLLTGL